MRWEKPQGDEIILGRAATMATPGYLPDAGWWTDRPYCYLPVPPIKITEALLVDSWERYTRNVARRTPEYWEKRTTHPVLVDNGNSVAALNEDGTATIYFSEAAA